LVALIEKAVGFMNDLIWSYVLIALLIVLGIYFTIQTRFVQFRQVGEMFRLMGEGVSGSTKGKESISSFQAFCISTASRVGTGNLAGVAMAISVGGPGAVFWMWLIAVIGSASAFVESTLAQIFKVKDESGFRGGPAYYMDKGLKQRWMGVLFAILITLSFGLVFNSVQANTISLAFETAYGVNRTVMGLILAGITAFIIFGGVKRVAKVAEWMVPVMAGGYVLVALYVILTNITAIPSVLGAIVSGAFGLEQAVGGGIGAAMMMGIKRGLFSNEAGMGSAANAAATADVSHPVKQGLIQALGVFVDTLLVCSATAFIILLSGAYTTQGLDGIALTQTALSSHVGSWGSTFLSLVVFLFAFSSVIGNYYYGETNIEFLNSSKTWLVAYRIGVVGMVMFGSVAKIGIVWDMADLFMGLMALLNLVAITLLGKFAFAALKDYIQQRKAGKNPVFRPGSIQGLPQVECWGEGKQE
jgi:AGCS family alanine or glycine:cation symporter